MISIFKILSLKTAIRCIVYHQGLQSYEILNRYFIKAFTDDNIIDYLFKHFTGLLMYKTLNILN